MKTTKLSPNQERRLERHKNYLRSLIVPENVVMKLDYDDLNVWILRQGIIIEARMSTGPRRNLFDEDLVNVVIFSARGTRLLNLMEKLEQELRNFIEAYWST